MHRGETRRTLLPASMAACSCFSFSKRLGLFVNLTKATDPLSIQKKCSGAWHSVHGLQPPTYFIGAIGSIRTPWLNPQNKATALL